ncbi:MAG TPA: hypothetical protein VKT25_07680, partial [Ktedonobacteraceae bacterium]|nr:hypothetical protein [Ktedonobacteraceae bacterium]
AHHHVFDCVFAVRLVHRDDDHQAKETIRMSSDIRSDSGAERVELLMKRMVHVSTMALIFFSIAWFCLTVGVFTVNPIGPVGIFFLCVGLPCVAISIFYFVRYALISRKIKDAMES